MIRRHRCGQAAMEFLLTYGWAIITILVSIGALAYFTNGFGFWVPDVCRIDPPFACAEAKAQTDGTVLLGVQNGVEDLNSATLTLTCEDDTQQTYMETGVIPVNARLNGTLIRFTCPPTTGTFSANVEITYQALDESVTHTAEGKISIAIEP